MTSKPNKEVLNLRAGSSRGSAREAEFAPAASAGNGNGHGAAAPSEAVNCLAAKPMPASKPAIFVVDTDPATCEAVQEMAATMNLGCAVYASGQDFLGAYRPSWTGCVVLELRLPGISGLQIQEYLVARGSLLPLIFVSGQATVPTAVRVMRAGALCVLEKPVREHELWDAVDEAILLNRQRIELSLRRDRERDLVESLTQKERQVLRLLAEGKSKKMIAKELEVCVRTIENRRNQLMQKLGATSLAELVRYALAVPDAEPVAVDHHYSPRCHTPR